MWQQNILILATEFPFTIEISNTNKLIYLIFNGDHSTNILHLKLIQK